MSLLPQFGFLELILVAALALVVVGPKDLPRLMRSAGRAVGQMRRMATEFTSAFEQMAREADLEDMRKEIEALKKQNPISDVKRAVDDAMQPVKTAVDAEKNALNKASSGAGGAGQSGAGGAGQPDDEAPVGDGVNDEPTGAQTKAADAADATGQPETADPAERRGTA